MYFPVSLIIILMAVFFSLNGFKILLIKEHKMYVLYYIIYNIIIIIYNIIIIIFNIIYHKKIYRKDCLIDQGARKVSFTVCHSGKL